MTHRGQPTTVELVVRNRGYLRIPYLSLVDTTGGLYAADRERRVISLGPKEATRIRYTVKGVNRGAYRLGPVRVRASDPLGLFPRQFEIRELARVVIYPQVYPVNLIDHQGLPAGTVHVSNPVYEDATRYRSVREYVPGDDPRRISWSVSARMGRLHSLQYLPTTYFPTLIILNLTASEYQQRHRFHHTERAIEAAASLVFYAVSKGQQIGLVSSGFIKGTTDCPSLPIRNGSDHGSLLLGTLARLSVSDSSEDAVATLFRRPTPFGTRIQYVGPRLRRHQIEFLASRFPGGSNVELFYVQEPTRANEESLPRLFTEYVVREYGANIIVGNF
jgi:uncharacterized protein (DUF58 family)